jgi:hypothetical protein
MCVMGSIGAYVSQFRKIVNVMGCQVGTAAQRASAGAAMIKDVASRGYALSVGAVGSRTLLDTLSDQGDAGHDAALRVVLRREFPGWGYMAVTSNASTCWEGWWV